jgi:ankyrin repeat protein
MKLITDKNCNYATKENKWTPLMILCGLGAKGTVSAIRQVKELGGDPFLLDVEGWNALHWAAFHGSLEAAKALGEDVDKLGAVTDKEGKTPLDHAMAEGNDAVAKFLQENMSATERTANTEDGLRKRK